MRERKHTRRNGPHPVWAGIGTVLGLGAIGSVVALAAPTSPIVPGAVGVLLAGVAYFGADKVSAPNAGGIRVGAILSLIGTGIGAAYRYALASRYAGQRVVVPVSAVTGPASDTALTVAVAGALAQGASTGLTPTLTATITAVSGAVASGTTTDPQGAAHAITFPVSAILRVAA